MRLPSIPQSALLGFFPSAASPLLHATILIFGAVTVSELSLGLWASGK